MTTNLLADAFGHHLWASQRLLDSCLALDAAQLATTVPGTYGSILDTVRHLVGADASYLAVLSGERFARIDEEAMDLPELRATMDRIAGAWPSLLAEDLDPDAVIVRHHDDGSTSSAAVGIRLAQVLHHGTDHRSQICTALTSLGIDPPWIDVWAYGDAHGRAGQTPPTDQASAVQG